MKRVHAFIFGKVQGVFFRVSIRDLAFEEGISGWVRNLPDGSVEVVAEGREEAVKKLVDFLHHGPSGAVVEEIKIENENVKGEEGFLIKTV